MFHVEHCYEKRTHNLISGLFSHPHLLHSARKRTGNCASGHNQGARWFTFAVESHGRVANECCAPWERGPALRGSGSSSPARAKEAPDLRYELRLTSLLGAPLALGELGWMSTYIVDALMVGRLHNSALPIAASSLGNTIFYAIAFCAIFMLNGLETLIAQAFGAR